MLKDGCEAGCMTYTGGEIKHHKDCQFYKDSLSEDLDNLKKENKKLMFMIDNELSFEDMINN